MTSSILDNQTQHEQYVISGKMKVKEEVWNEYLNILHKHNIDVPKFPIWTDWWDGDGENTTVTKEISENDHLTTINNILKNASRLL